MDFRRVAQQNPNIPNHNNQRQTITKFHTTPSHPPAPSCHISAIYVPAHDAHTAHTVPVRSSTHGGFRSILNISVDILIGCGTAPCPRQWNKSRPARANSAVEQVLLARVKYGYHVVITKYGYTPREQLLQNIASEAVFVAKVHNAYGYSRCIPTAISQQSDTPS